MTEAFGECASCPWPAVTPPVTVPLGIAPEHPCPYLPGRSMQARGLYAVNLSSELYERFVEAGFRRSGYLVYQPICRGCRACVSIRIPVDRFAPTRSQRRCAGRNADLRVTVAEPAATDEKHALYSRYLRRRHAASEADSFEQFEQFLYRSPVRTLEFTYRLGERLLAVGICDLTDRSLSSVYFYFDPDDPRRGLGTFGAMHEIEFARQWGRRWYHLGYWIAGCKTMAYKSNFGPNQRLATTGVWVEMDCGGGILPTAAPAV